eukprot:GILK01010994.1.p1 GENE.GILK01010994.1~~GILK01010994.1.p1  ORF type:complete len:436 (-),score=55.75 GILK01010994.1:394-1701(-)
MRLHPRVLVRLSIHVRCFASRVKDTKILPFKLSDSDAKSSYDQWVRASWFAPTWQQNSSHIREIKSIFVPFFDVAATVDVDYVARIGRLVPTGRNQTTMVWQTVKGRLPNRSYPGLPVYAGFKYRRQDVEASCGDGGILKYAVPITQSILQDRDVAPFSMFPDFAFDMALSRIRAQETQYLHQSLRRLPNEKVSVDDLQVHILSARVVPVYVPMYVLEYRWYNKKFKVFINGFSGEVSGERQYSLWKSAAAGGTGFAVLASFSGEDGVAASFILGSMLAALASQIYPMASRFIKGKRRAYEAMRNQASGNSSGFEYEQERGYQQQASEEERRWQRTQRTEESYERRRQSSGRSTDYQQQQRQREQYGSGPVDPYQVLGVRRSQTTEEIKNAFRKLAMQSHPDLRSDPKEKKIAEEKFKKIVAAYQQIMNEPSRRK